VVRAHASLQTRSPALSAVLLENVPRTRLQLKT
jgi:hypothetical protein